MEKLSEIREKIKLNEEQIINLVDSIQDLENPINNELKIQYSFGGGRRTDFEIVIPERFINRHNHRHVEIYQKVREFTLEDMKLDLKSLKENIKRLQAKEKAIMDSLLENEEPKMLK